MHQSATNNNESSNTSHDYGLSLTTQPLELTNVVAIRLLTSSTLTIKISNPISNGDMGALKCIESNIMMMIPLINCENTEKGRK